MEEAGAPTTGAISVRNRKLRQFKVLPVAQKPYIIVGYVSMNLGQISRV